MAAGLGFKTFTTGEVLTAADTNGYLMQGVLVFASAAARDAAITSPQEGQCCYLKDTDAVLTYSGAAWVGFDDSNAIQNSIVDAKGDLVAASGADTPARLAVGANGETLVADSAATTGLRYQAHTEAGKNFVINGGADIWQRGTSVASSGQVYTGDRFETWSTAGAATTTSRQATGDTTNLPAIQYCARVQRNSGQTLTGAIAYQTSLESINSIPLAGKSIVVSFYARKGADFSATSNLLTVKVITGTGTDQKVSGYTGASEIVNTTKTLTATWQRFEFTATVGATATEIGIQPYYAPTGTAGTNDYFEITGIQLELGSVASTFSRAAGNGNIQGELAACQRYYWRGTGPSNTPYGGGASWSGTKTYINVQFPITMRVSPTSIDFSSLYISNPGLSSIAVTNVTQVSGGTFANILEATVASGATSQVFYTLQNNGASGYLGLNAEL